MDHTDPLPLYAFAYCACIKMLGISSCHLPLFSPAVPLFMAFRDFFSLSKILIHTPGDCVLESSRHLQTLPLITYLIRDEEDAWQQGDL